MANILTAICNKICYRRLAYFMDPINGHHTSKKGNLQLCQNYQTISLISRRSKVTLKVILNRLKPQAENIIAEEQAGFRAGHSTTEHIFNFRILCVLATPKNLYYIFIDFKKAFDRVWHAALWATMRKYNIGVNLVQILEHLYDKATSTVLMNGTQGNGFTPPLETARAAFYHPLYLTYF